MATPKVTLSADDEKFFAAEDEQAAPTEAEVKAGLDAAGKLASETEEGETYISDEEAAAAAKEEPVVEAAPVEPAAPAPEEPNLLAELASAQEARWLAEQRAAELEAAAGKTAAQLAEERDAATQKAREDRLSVVEADILKAIADGDVVTSQKLTFERERLARDINRAEQERTLARFQSQQTREAPRPVAPAGTDPAAMRAAAQDSFFRLNKVDEAGQKRYYETVNQMLLEAPGKYAQMPMWQAMHEALQRSRNVKRAPVAPATSAVESGSRMASSKPTAPALPDGVTEKDFARAARLYGGTVAEYRAVFNKYAGKRG